MNLKPLQHLSRRTYRYLVVGASVYAFELLVIIVAQQLGAGPVLSVGVSFCLGTIVSFLLQKLITFGDKRLHHKVLVPQFIATCLLVVFNFGFTLLVAKRLADYVPVLLSRTIALGITASWNFYLYKRRIFKLEDEPVIY